MYFWNVKGLAKDLLEGKVTEGGKMKYLLAYAILSALQVEIIRLIKERFGPILLVQAFGMIVILAGGILACYQANRKGDGRDFIERFICLSLPLTIRIGVLSFVVYGAYWAAGILIVGEHFSPNETPGPFDLAVAYLINIIYYVWMRQNILKISTAPKVTPTTLGTEIRQNGLKYKAILRWALVSIIVFILGLAAGGYLGFKEAIKPFKFMVPFMTIAIHEEITKYQYLNGDYNHAKTALLNNIAFLEKARESGSFEDQYLGERTYFVDTGLAYGRLALLAEKAGKTDEKDKAFQEASNRFKMAGWKDFSEAKIREVLQKLDK
jgi:hypothetical protein